MRATWNVSQTSMKEPTKGMWLPSRAINGIEPCTGGPGAGAPMTLLEQSENHQTGIFPSSRLLRSHMWRRTRAPQLSLFLRIRNVQIKCLHVFYCSINKTVLLGFCSVPVFCPYFSGINWTIVALTWAERLPIQVFSHKVNKWLMISVVTLPLPMVTSFWLTLSTKERRDVRSPPSLYFLFFITKDIRPSNFPIFRCDRFPNEMQPLY